jgi:chemotaxis protein MotB
MARKKHHAAHENHERWLVSYADFITLLFAFFVVMFASSQTDKAKAQAISDSVKSALEKGASKAVVREILGGTVDDTGKGNAMMKGPGGAVKEKSPDPVIQLLPSMTYLTKALEDEIKQGKIEIRLESRGLVLSLHQAAFFPSGEDTVDPATYKTIEKIAGNMRELPNPIRLEGHTDAIPIHTSRFRSNWELSTARAIAMLELFATRYQVPSNRFAVAGHADTVPVASNVTEEGRARNRRVDVVILNKEVLTKVPAPAAPAKSPSPHKQ